MLQCPRSHCEWLFAALQEKDRLKKEKDEADAKFKYALVDGRREQVSSLSPLLQPGTLASSDIRCQSHCCKQLHGVFVLKPSCDDWSCSDDTFVVSAAAAGPHMHLG